MSEHSSNETLLYLVRHGESLYNAENRVQGQTDVALSELGERQALAVSEYFAENQIPLEAIYSSPLKRAYQTAVPTAQRLGLEIQVEERLQEINVGIFQGMLWSEIAQRCPEESKRWYAYDPDYIVPQGESRRQLMDRGHAALAEIAAKGHRVAAVFSHGGLLGAAIKSLLEIPAPNHPFTLYNGSISQLQFGGRHLRLLTLNYVEHLRAQRLARETRTGDL